MDILPYLEQIRQETQIPVVYVSHEIDEMARLTDMLVVMSRGEVIGAGETAEMFARLDLGPALGRQKAGVLVAGIVSAVDAAWGLASVDIGGQTIEIVGSDFEAGQPVRLMIRARDVSISLAAPENVSIRNRVRCVIEEVSIDESAFAELLLRCGSQIIRSRITRKSASELGLAKGMEVVALLKSVSVERRAITPQA